MDPEAQQRLLTRIENRISRSYRGMVREIQDQNSIAEIEARIAAGHVDALIVGVDDAAEKLAIDINTGYVQAGQKMSRWIDGQVDSRATFNVADEKAVGWMTDQADTMIQAMVSDQQQVAQRVLADGRAQGWDDHRIAEEIQKSVGLNEQQYDYVASYRNALNGGDFQNALDRQLADDRYDAPLKRAMENGTNLADKRVDAMVDKYRANWIDERADFIANMEGQSAMNAGELDALTQAIDAGTITADIVQKSWSAVGDSKTRRSHRALDGVTVSITDVFISGDGNELRYPGDENAPVDDTANCRCTLEYSLDLSQLAQRKSFRLGDDERVAA